MILLLGVELAARFAYPPNALSYCGTSAFEKTFAKFLRDKNPVNRKALENSIRVFRAHYAYLKLIARANHLQPFDYKVCEAFWLGSRLLEKVEKEQIAKLILTEFCGPGLLSKGRAKRLAEGLTENFVPHHSFHPLYIHSISGVVPPTVKTSDNCRVSWGKVLRKSDRNVEVQSQKLVKKNGGLQLVPCHRKWKTADFLKCSKGDLVVAHWGVAVAKISSSQAKHLEKYTLKNISAANSLD